MNDAMMYAACIGGGLVLCGYMLGLSKGHRIGVQNAMAELIRANLLKPGDILRHYSRNGNREAAVLLRNFESNVESDKDPGDAEDKGVQRRGEDHTDR